MNLATNVAGLINSKARKQDNDQCKHFSSINKRGATKQRHKPHTVAERHNMKTEEKQSARPKPYYCRKMKGRS